MLHEAIKYYFPSTSLQQQQSRTIILITFWTQFSAYALNTILILFLTRPLLEHGLGYTPAHAYVFLGVTQATAYLMPLLGGVMADQILGIRRAILCGSILVSIAYLLVLLSSYTLEYGDQLFIAAFALMPACNSLLMGTASSMITKIYNNDSIQTKSAMTFYYMAINMGGLLAAIIAPSLLESRFGPLSIFTLAFIGKSLAALNFAKHYRLYDNIVEAADKRRMTLKTSALVFVYILLIYGFTLMAYFYMHLASIIITVGCFMGILGFFLKTLFLNSQARTKQLIALLLIVEAIAFFIIFNQMSSTLILFAQQHSNLHLLGIAVSPAHYQLLNPLLVIILGMQLPRFYQRFPQFTIPYQFASGTILAGIALLLMAGATYTNTDGLINGNYIGLTNVLITLAELWISAAGLSMIGLYCDGANIALAMGVWYLAASLSNTISAHIAGFVALPQSISSPLTTLILYRDYYFLLGASALILGLIMGLGAIYMQKKLRRQALYLA